MIRNQKLQHFADVKNYQLNFFHVVFCFKVKIFIWSKILCFFHIIMKNFWVKICVSFQCALTRPFQDLDFFSGSVVLFVARVQNFVAAEQTKIINPPRLVCCHNLWPPNYCSDLWLKLVGRPLLEKIGSCLRSSPSVNNSHLCWSVWRWPHNP